MTTWKEYLNHAKRVLKDCKIDDHAIDAVVYACYKQHSTLETLLASTSQYDPTYLPMYDPDEITQEINISDVEVPDLSLDNDFFKCECGADSISSPYHSDWCPKHSVT